MIDTAEVLECPVEGAGNCVGVREVAANGKNPVLRFGSGEFGLGSLERGFVAARQHDACAFGKQSCCNSFPDATRGAGYENDLAVEMEVHGASVAGQRVGRFLWLKWWSA